MTLQISPTISDFFEPRACTTKQEHDGRPAEGSRDEMRRLEARRFAATASCSALAVGSEPEVAKVVRERRRGNGRNEREEKNTRGDDLWKRRERRLRRRVLEKKKEEDEEEDEEEE